MDSSNQNDEKNSEFWKKVTFYVTFMICIVSKYLLSFTTKGCVDQK